MKNLILKSLGFTFITSIVFAQEGGDTKIFVTDTSLKVNSSFSIEVESAFTNSYLWRGIEYNSGIIMQPSVNLEYKGFILNIWNSTGVLETKENSNKQEIDFTLSKTIESGNFYFEPTLIFYSYPSKKYFSATAEASVYASYYEGNFGFFINPSFDFLSNVGGAFSETGITYDYETARTHIVANLAYGVANEKFIDFNIAEGEILIFNSMYRLVDINGSFKQKLNETIFIKPSFNFFHLIGSDLSKILNPNKFNCAFSLGAEF